MNTQQMCYLDGPVRRSRAQTRWLPSAAASLGRAHNTPDITRHRLRLPSHTAVPRTRCFCLLFCLQNCCAARTRRTFCLRAPHTRLRLPHPATITFVYIACHTLHHAVFCYGCSTPLPTARTAHALSAYRHSHYHRQTNVTTHLHAAHHIYYAAYYTCPLPHRTCATTHLPHHAAATACTATCRFLPCYPMVL